LSGVAGTTRRNTAGNVWKRTPDLIITFKVIMRCLNYIWKKNKKQNGGEDDGERGENKFLVHYNIIERNSNGHNRVIHKDSTQN